MTLTLEMIRMGMGIDDIADIPRFDAIQLHAFQQRRHVPRQAGIDQSLNGAADVIAVAVVVIQVCPFINIDCLR